MNNISFRSELLILHQIQDKDFFNDYIINLYYYYNEFEKKLELVGMLKSNILKNYYMLDIIKHI